MNSVFTDSADGEWISPRRPEDPLLWGRTEGIVFGLPSEGGLPGPRGLIRIGLWNPSTQKAELVNFVAIEPVVEGEGPRHRRMAFSELEPSLLDAPQRGKRLWIADESLSVQRLAVRIEVEPFTANGAHLFLLARMHCGRPHEVAFSVYHHYDSLPLQENTLTATMGNYERLRLLWLRDCVIDSRLLYEGYQGFGFVEKESYPLGRMLRAPDGSAWALCASDEEDPATTDVDHPWWTYKSVKVTQYWYVPFEHIQPDLRIRVNGRRVYWGSRTLLIPGGIAFENFEVRQRYVPGQTFVFGLSRKTPFEILSDLSVSWPS